MCGGLVFRCVVSRAARSGATDLGTNSSRSIGDSGLFWSSITHTNINDAHYLDFNGVDTLPSYYYARSLGFSARCLAF